MGSIPRFFDFQNSEFRENPILKQKIPADQILELSLGILKIALARVQPEGFIPIGLNWCWWQMIETILLTTNWDIGDRIDDCSHKYPQFIHQVLYSVTNVRKYFHQLIANSIDVPVAIGEFAISMLAKDIWDALCWQLCDVGDRFEMLVTDSSHQKSHQHHHCHFDRVFFPTSRSLHLEVNSGYSP